MITINRLDHLVLTVRDLDATCTFYQDVLGMKAITFGEGRKALTFGNQKINLHEYGNEFEPKSDRPTPGSADFCLILDTPLDAAIDHLKSCNVTIERGPVAKSGATGPIESLYFRDPDQNLIEISVYV